MDNKIRVLVVDDSSFARFSISKQLTTDPEVEIIDTARNGVEALQKIQEKKPDVVTLDVEMPQMDGITTLRRLMVECPTPVVMLSSLTGEGAVTTVKALQLGAVDFFLKPSPTAPAGVNADVVDDLIAKVKVAARLDRRKLIAINKSPRRVPTGDKKNTVRSTLQQRVVVIGCSTGGPRALSNLLPELPGDLPAPILIVQHMPPGFTGSLAERLNAASEIEIREAKLGDRISPGVALFAPSDKHMTVESDGSVHFTNGSRECGLRPAVNVTMVAAAHAFGKKVLGVVLTGMGNDGTRGAEQIKQAGGEVVVEDESTCVVWGMPGSIVQAGLADTVVPLSGMPGEIVRRCKNKVSSGV